MTIEKITYETIAPDNKTRLEYSNFQHPDKAYKDAVIWAYQFKGVWYSAGIERFTPGFKKTPGAQNTPLPAWRIN